MSTRNGLLRRTADQWYTRYPDKTARAFHNLLLREMPELRNLLDLFALPEPIGRGLYNHHDGYRS